MFEQVKQEIDDKIKTNGNNEITATRLNGVLQDMIDATEEELNGYVQKTDPPSPAAGDIVVFDEYGGFGTSEKTVNDFATAAQGAKADTALQPTGVKTINNQSIVGSGNITIEGGGTDDYSELDNKPQINSVALSGNKSASDLGLATAAQGAKADTAVQPSALNYYVQKSQTTGLLKNDGTVDTQTAGKAANALQPISGAQENNFAAFDENGGIKDSGFSDASFATASQGEKADNAIQGVKLNGTDLQKDDNNNVNVSVPTITIGETHTGNPNTDALVDNVGTSSALELEFTIPRGADGQDAVNPFKGWFTTDNIPTTGQEGDYCNVSNTSVTPHTVTIYRWSTAQNAFVDTGEVPDTATGETFASGETLQEVAIDDSHLVNPVNTADSTQPVLAKAEDVMQLKAKLEGVTAAEEKVVPVLNTNYFDGKYVRNDKTIQNGSTPTGGVPNGILIVNVSNAKKVRFLGFESDTAPTSGYGFSENPIDPTSTAVQLDYIWVFNGNADTERAVELVVDVPEGMNYFVCTIRKYGTPSTAVMTINDFYCYKKTGTEALNQTDIVNDLTTGGVNKVLSAEMGKELRQNIIQTTATEYDITDTTPRIQGYINASGTVVIYGTSAYYSVYIPIPEGVEKIKIVGNENYSIYCGLASIPVIGESAAFSDGFSGRVFLNQNSEAVVLVDSTLKYLYLNIKDIAGGGVVVDRTPQEISFIHEVNRIDDLDERVTNLEDNPACVIDDTIPDEAEQNHVPSTSLVKPYLDILTTTNSGELGETDSIVAYISVDEGGKIITCQQGAVNRYFVRYYKLPADTQKLHFKCVKNPNWPSGYSDPSNPLRYGFTTEKPANDVYLSNFKYKSSFVSSVEETFDVLSSYKYFVVYYVQLNADATYVINDVSFSSVKIGLPNVPTVQASDYLGLTQGKIGTNGEVEDDEYFVTTDFIKGGGYFHLSTWGDYRIYSAHLYDNRGNLIAYNYLSEPDYDMFRKATNRQSYGIYLMPQWMMRIVISKNDNFTEGNYLETTGKCLVEDYPIDTFRYFRKSDGVNFVVPDAIANDYETVKYRAMTLYSCIFNPRRDFVASTSSTAANPTISKYFFKKGRQRCGVPYSDHPQYANIPARHVSMRTFASALANKYSVEYTENPYTNSSAYGFVYSSAIALARNYFAMACNIFWGYVMGIEPIWNCGAILGNNRLTGETIYNGADNESSDVEPADNVQVLDTFISTGHIGLILDIINADGKKYIVTAESTTPTVQIRMFDETEFNSFFKTPYSGTNYYKIKRYAAGNAPKYKPFDENGRVVQHLPIDMYHGAFSNPDICPYLGDYCSILNTQSMYINVQRHTNKYDRIKVYKLSGGSYAQDGSDILLSSGTDWANDPDGEDWVKMTLSSLGAGKYRVEATNTDGTVTSGFVYFEVIEVSMSYSDGAVTFSATGGTPYLLAEEYLSGFLLDANHVYVAIDENTQSPISYTKKGSGTKLALYVEGDYGVVKKSV